MRIIVNKKFKHNILKNKTTANIINTFGLNAITEQVVFENFEFHLQPNKLYYICGYSGSGKSVLLREIAEQAKEKYNITYIEKWQNLDIPNLHLIEFFPEIDTDKKLRYLSKCGLGEAWKFISKYETLSDGEKFRFILYKTLMELKDKENSVLIFDEFCSTLDRITAKSIAAGLKKLTKELGVTLIVATAHDDIGEYINADVNIVKEYSKNVDYKTN